jgi:outer membrane protein assembly factor BamA
LGGDLRAALLATLSVPVPVPFLAKSQMRAFVFANAGVLSNVTAASSGAPVFHPGAVRASVGGGFSIVAAGAIRLEATYAVPVLSAPQDQHKSFQLGVGMTVN